MLTIKQSSIFFRSNYLLYALFEPLNSEMGVFYTPVKIKFLNFVILYYSAVKSTIFLRPSGTWLSFCRLFYVLRCNQPHLTINGSYFSCCHFNVKNFFLFFICYFALNSVNFLLFGVVIWDFGLKYFFSNNCIWATYLLTKFCGIWICNILCVCIYLLRYRS